MKNFYAANLAMPKVHINNTNLPLHLEKMLELLIHEESQIRTSMDGDHITAPPSAVDTDANHECFQFVISSRPLDLLADICITDSPPGATVCILNWMRRFLSCLQRPRLEQKSIHEPILKLVGSVKNTAGKASPYELEEIMFLLTVAGVVRKDPVLINLFLPKHLVAMSNTLTVGTVVPRHNSLFDGALAATAPVVELATAPDDTHDTNDGVDVVDRALLSLQMCGDGAASGAVEALPVNANVAKTTPDRRPPCDCGKSDSLVLFDTIVQYFDSADSLVVVRACEATLILVSLPSIVIDCCAVDLSLRNFSTKLAEHVGNLCQAIPEDMDNGDIEDCAVSWGLLPRDTDTVNYIGRSQLTEFLCWLDYANCVAKECASHAIAVKLADRLRCHLFENAIEPLMIEPNYTAFALVFASKVINSIDARVICDRKYFEFGRCQLIFDVWMIKNV